MSRLGGLRGRLLVAFVFTSVLTLAVVGAIVLGPLQNELRDQSIDNLNDAVLVAAPEFRSALREELPDTAPERPRAHRRASRRASRP